MTPREVSELIAGHHQALVATFAELFRVAQTMRKGGPIALRRTATLALELCDELSAHMIVEAERLVPALRDADAWGEARAAFLTGRLTTRRGEVEELRRSCRAPRSETLCGTVLRFIEERRAGMKRAQIRDLSVLRDDVVAIDFQDG